MLDKLRAVEERYDSLTEEMGRPDVSADYQRLQELNKERSSLETVVTLYRDLRRLEEQIEEASSHPRRAFDEQQIFRAKNHRAQRAEILRKFFHRPSVERQIPFARRPVDFDSALQVAGQNFRR